VIIAGAASALLVVLTARRLYASGGGYGLRAAIAAGALSACPPMGGARCRMGDLRLGTVARRGDLGDAWIDDAVENAVLVATWL
jgi:hypothetical protein